MDTQESLIEKIPPQNLEAEASVLGAMLFSPDAVYRGVEVLKESFFYSESHRIIFTAILTLFERNQAIDLITVTEELRRHKHLESIGGASYLTQLTASVPSAANVEFYAKIVKEKALLRGLINTATQIIQESFENTTDGSQVLDHAERMIFEISQDRIEGKFIRMGEIIKDSIEAIDKLYQRKEHVTGLASGFHDFDVKTAGLQFSDLIVVAGRPSMGKSAFVCGIAEHVSVVLGKPVALFYNEIVKN
jgi:replicative DNA helicase